MLDYAESSRKVSLVWEVNFIEQRKKKRKVKNISRRKFFTIDLITTFFFFINNSMIFFIIGIIYYVCERSRRKPVDEEDAKLGRWGSFQSNSFDTKRHVTHENILTIFRLIYLTSLYTLYTYIIHIFYIVLWQVFGAIFTVSSNFPPTIELRTRTQWIFFLLSPACRTNFRDSNRDSWESRD